MIRYSREILYHFNCDECGRWWSIGDYHVIQAETLTCPHCGCEQGVEEIEIPYSMADAMLAARGEK